jgi:thiamine biosynthesis lipoprotein
MFTIGFLVMSLGEGYSKEVLIKRSQYLMGTIVFVTGVAPEEKVAKKAVAEGLAEIGRIEQLMSTWIPTSELSKVNAAAGKHPVQGGFEDLASYG